MKKRQNVLVLAAHMDDEVLGCGGTIARHAAEGDTVRVAWFTDGVSSREHGDAVVRREEAFAAWKAMTGKGLQDSLAFVNGQIGSGVGRRWYAFDYPDQQMDKVALSELASAVTMVLNETQPSVVYTHWPHDLNQDHRAVAQATLIATRAWTGRAPRLLAYEVPESTAQAYGSQPFTPNVFVDIGIQNYIDAKVSAIEEYSSERRAAPHPRSWPMIRAQAAVRGAAAGRNYAEAFVLLREVVR